MPTTPETPAERIALARKVQDNWIHCTIDARALGPHTFEDCVDIIDLLGALADDLEAVTCADPDYHHVPKMVRCHKCGRRFCRYHLYRRSEEMLCYECLPPHSNYSERPESEDTANDPR